MRTGIIVIVIIGVLVIAFSPVLTIWALNTLIGTAIPLNLGTWFAALWLMAVVAAGKSSKS